MKILVLADIDDLRWRHGPGRADLLLSCGDTADPVILEAAEAYDCSSILAVKGNHDGAESFPDPVEDLHLRTIEHSGLTFGGFNGSWKYKPRGPFLYEQEEARKLLEDFPPVDVLLTHNSPRRIHDRDDGVHTGFEALNNYIARAKPKVLFHGHQHLDRETKLGETRIIGVYGRRLIEI